MTGARRYGAGTNRAPRRLWLVWSVGWFGVCTLAMANAVAREALLADRVGDRTAHQISTGTLLAAIGGATWALHRRRPLPDGRAALAVGTTWTALTLTFEFAFGHYVAKKTWSELLDAYDVTSGDLWVLVPLGTLVAPEAVRRLQQP